MEAANVLLDPPPSVFAACGASEPANPFYTPAYVAARRSLGDRAGVLQLRRSDDAAVLRVPFFLTPLRLANALEIPSIPADINPSSMVAVLTHVARRYQVASIAIPGFASPDGDVAPPLPWPTTRCPRTEFVIDLTAGDLHAAMSRSHRQRARQGQRSGLTLVRRRDAAACADHTHLMASSMSRRRDRGEAAATNAPAAFLQPFLDSGAGELFQAVRDDVVYSSMLVLRARLGAYDQSSGTTGEGMSIGAAQFLIAAAGQALAVEGVELLNLGGVREHETGLRAFKSHFGAREHAIVATMADSRSRARRLGESLWRRFRGAQGDAPVARRPQDSIETGENESVGALR